MFKCVFLFESVFGEISMFLPLFWLVFSSYKCLEGMSVFLYTEFCLFIQIVVFSVFDLGVEIFRSDKKTYWYKALS